MKFLSIVVIGILIWSLNNIIVLSSSITGFVPFFRYVFLRILIGICIFTIITIILDLIPIREIVYFFIKKVDKERVAIDVGIGQIIELDKSESRLISKANFIIGLLLIISSIFVFYLVYLFTTNTVSIENLTSKSLKINPTTVEYFTMAAFFIFGTCLLMSGILTIYINREIISLGK
jgi:hypothetical protein